MFETTGALAIVEPVRWLVSLVALPLVWSLVSWLARRREVVAGYVAVAGAIGTALLTAAALARLSLGSPGRVLTQHLGQVARLGQLDLALDLAMDRPAGAFALTVSVVAIAAVAHAALSGRADAPRTSALVGLLTAFLMLVCLGDGLALVLVGLGGAAVSAWAVDRGARGPALVAGNAATAFGLFFLFWTLGGSFGPSGYTSDAAPRVVLVATGAATAEGEAATVAMSTHEGALVSSDTLTPLPGEPLRSPFRVALPPGIYTFRVQNGVASADVIVPRVQLAPGQAYVLSPYGPTASLRTLGDQIAVPRAPTPGGPPPQVRALLAGRTLLGVRASAIILLLVLGGALVHAHAAARQRERAGPGTTLQAIAPAVLAVRLAPLVDASALDGALVAVMGGASAIVVAARAARFEEPTAAMRGVLGTSASTAVACVGLGAPSAALVIGIAALTAAASAIVAIDARRDPRWLGVACAASVGLLPGAGAAPGYAMALTAAGGGAFAGRVGAAAVSGMLLVAWTLASLAAFRVYDAGIQASSQSRASIVVPTRGLGAIVVALASTSLAAGLLLGAGTSAFGGRVVPVATRMAPGASIDVPRAIAAAAVFVAVAAAVLGALLARRVAARPDASWVRALSAPSALISRLGAATAAGAAFLGRSVEALDRDVVHDVGRALHDVALSAGRGVRRVEDALASRSASGRDRAVGATLARLSLDHPRTADRARTFLVLAMVALLGLVVLSSLLLG